jgi:CheY-like chemotaxis protein
MADILDDDRQIRRLISHILRGAGHSVREAPDGRSGLDLFTQAAPALVITDFVMPDTEGIETSREIRAKNASVRSWRFSGGGPSIYLCAATG